MADKQYLDGLVQDYIQNNERGLTKPIGRVYSPLVYRACQTVSLSAVAIGIAVSVRAPMTGVLSLGIATVAALIGFIAYRAVWQAVEIAARNARAFAKLMLLTGVDRQTRMAAVQKYMILRMPLTAKHWYEKYGAIPIVLSHDELEMSVPKPVPMNETVGLAQELYAVCPDVIDQSSEDEATVGRLADSLRQSKIWYFWWD